MNYSGNAHGFLSKYHRSLDQCGVLNNSIVVLDIPIKSSATRQTSCSTGNLRCIYVNKPNGFWQKNQPFRNYGAANKQPSVIKPKRFDTLLIFGDSVGKSFFRSIKKTAICRVLFKKCKNIYTWTYVRHKYFGKANEETLYDNKDFNDTLFLKGVSESVLSDKDMKSNKSLAIFNFGLHLIRSLNLKKIFDVFEKFLKVLHSIGTILQNNTPRMIWKTTTSPAAPTSRHKTSYRFITYKVKYYFL